MTAAGIAVALLGVLIITQVTAGRALERLGITEAIAGTT
jgi:hypothetical protein